MKTPFACILLMVAALTRAGEADPPETIKDAWAQMVLIYNSEMHAPVKTIGIGYAENFATTENTSHTRAAWYYGRINFLYGQWTIDPTKEREKAVLAKIAEYVGTNAPVKLKL